jgi:MOSC domain-containing protein YiiM
MAEPHWVKRFARENRPGTYLRVVSPGAVKAGDAVVVVDRPGHGVTIGRAFRAWMTEPSFLPELLEVDGLPDDLRESIERRLRR